MQNKISAICLIAAAVVLLIIGSGFLDGPPGELVSETYIVRPGDTLWTIAGKYVDKNTHGPRDIREFIAGIEELNYDSVFKNRKPGEIRPGDNLKINYWIKGENK